MAGETLPSHSVYNGAYMNNYPLSPTNIPLNTLLSDDGIDAPGANGLHKWQHTMGFKSLHPGGANFVMADGSVHFLTDTIDYQLYNELGTRAGGETAELP
jgi:prepilin-type processing-associated H-X9-DG protein